MIENIKSLSLYLVTDNGVIWGRDFFEVIKEAISGGVTMIQLREKNASAREFYEKALALKEITNQYKIPLIINDRVDIALAVKAEGVHVGQKDIPVKTVRKLTGDKMIVGATANTPQLAIEAQKQGADYLGSGAVFQTPTKADAKSMTMDTLKQITQCVTIPVVAIGGIQKQNVSLLQNTGIAGIAVSSGILRQNCVKQAARDLKLFG